MRAAMEVSRTFPIAAALVMAACTSAPVPQPPPRAEAQAPRSGSWLCASSPQSVSLQRLGVPADSRPIDLALSPEKVTVLLSPARIVIFPGDGVGTVDMIVGGTDDSWQAIDRDPSDGSLWVASDDKVSLLHITAAGERIVVAGPKTTGRGGFRQIRAGRDAIYATPAGAASAVWRLSREGKLLGQAFPRAGTVAVSGAAEITHGDFWLARDLEGAVVGFDHRSGQIYRADAEGSWALLADRFPPRSEHSRSLRGEAVGTSSESWYFTDARTGFFFLPGGPVLLGSQVTGLHVKGSALVRIRDGKIETAIEDCAGGGLLAVVTDSVGFAAVSGASTKLTAGVQQVIPGRVLVGRFSPGT